MNQSIIQKLQQDYINESINHWKEKVIMGRHPRGGSRIFNFGRTQYFVGWAARTPYIQYTEARGSRAVEVWATGKTMKAAIASLRIKIISIDRPEVLHAHERVTKNRPRFRAAEWRKYGLLEGKEK